MRPPANDNPARPSLLAFTAGQVQLLEGWWRNLACLLLGMALTLALPPFYALPLVFIAFSGLLWFSVGAVSARRAFFDGWWFGFGHFISGIYWIANALMVDAERFAWLIPFAVLGLSAGFALYTGLVGALLRTFRALTGLRRLLLFALLWMAAEWLRGHLLTGFPWNLTGYVWTFSVLSMQPASLVGVYGLGFFTVLLAGLPTLYSESMGRGRLAALLGVLLLWAGMLGYGGLRLAQAPEENVPEVQLRLVQAGIEQSLKWDPATRGEAITKHMALSRSTGFGEVTHVIWPESAMTLPFNSNDGRAQGLSMSVPPGGLLFTGVTRFTGSREEGSLQLFNSIKAVDDTASVVMAYDKYKLVPFGEFVPLRGLLPMDKITYGALDFSSGPVPSTYVFENTPPMRPLICYEAIFPELSHRAWPAWILNVTNDGWFGDSTGPYQHLQMSRMRAVEQGVSLVRAANTGISAVVDAYGRIRYSLPLGAVGVIDSPLPAPAPQPPLYGRYGDAVLLPLIFAALLLIGLLRRRG